jgi:acyl-CoA synthetase (NDP forming)/GNAT superfamily N-acetyltransferase
MASTHTGAHRGLVAGDQCWLVSMTSDAVAPSMQGQAFGVDDAVGVDAICADGGIVHLRPVVPEDADALRDLHQGVSDYSLYMRFFGLSRSAAITYVTRLVAAANPEHQAMSAWIGDRLIGVAAFERTGVDTAEVALLVADDHHRQGIGTLLLEHLAARARNIGISRFVADVLGENYLALRTLRDMGCQTTIRYDGGTALVEIDLRPDARAIATIDGRERTADEASLRHVLSPASVAVIGVGIHPASVGHQVLRNILAAGFVGTVHAVNPHHDSVLGVPCVPTPAQLPDAVDLAIVAVPAAQVPTVVGACGERNVRAVLVLTAGFGETGDTGMALQQRVVRIARHYGMRVVGPNCLGLVNTDPAVRLNATFADIPMNPGGLGLVSQSGALGIAVLAAANRDGLGTAQFVSIGNKADVSSNDLLLAWEGDHRVRVIALYLESLGNPRKFARIARRVASTKPIIAIKAGRSPAGQRAGQSHTAAAASSDVVIEALFRQAGVLRVNTMQEMLDTARVLCEQPLPTGSRVAVIGNSGGPEILAADAASGAGLDVIELAATTVQLLRQSVPSAASCRNPIDLGATVAPADMGAALRVLLDAAEVDAVLTVITDVAVTDADAVMGEIAAVASATDKPVVATRVGGQACSMPLEGVGKRALPVFTFPEPAASALAFATRYARIRAAGDPPVVRPSGITRSEAAAVVSTALAAGLGWLSATEVHRVLTDYGLPVCPQRVVIDPDDAVLAAADLGYPLAVKLADGGLHKTDIGGVRLGVTDEAALRQAFRDVTASRPAPTSVLLQPMSQGGTEVIIGAVQHDQFGPAVMVGAGGVFADVLADRVFRLAPITSQEADHMLDELRMSKLLDGFRGTPPVSRERLTELLVRVAALADDLPEVAELDLNPVICRGVDLRIVDARIRLAPAAPRPDQTVRQLPM